MTTRVRVAAVASAGLIFSGASIPIVAAITTALETGRSPQERLLFGAVAVCVTLAGIWAAQPVAGILKDLSAGVTDPHTREAVKALEAAARSRPADTELWDRESNNALLVHHNRRGWCITRMAMDELSHAWSDLNLGEPVATVAIKGYLLTRRCSEVHVYDDVVPLRLGQHRRPERIRLPEPSPRDVQAAGRLWTRLPTKTTPEQIRELAAQLRRADPIRQGTQP